MATTPSGKMDRRRAGSNYFQLDADRKRNTSTNRSHLNHGDTRGTFGDRLSMMEVLPPNTQGGNQMRGGGLEGDFADEVSVDFCCEVLYNKFGFQSGSVDNQREHVLLLLANSKARAKPQDPPGHHIVTLHKKLLGNYTEWCQFLGVSSITYTAQPQGDLKSSLHMDILLFLLLWGRLKVSEGWYLRQVVRPIWKEASNMQRKNRRGKNLEHTQVRNYDDINEYFWKKYCLNVDITHIGDELTKKHTKTYYEHRSIFTLVLNYYRIFQFNMMFMMVLMAIGFITAISPSGGQQWFAQFESMGEVVAPYKQQDVKLTYVGIVFALSSLGFCKTVLEACHGWHLLTASESSETSSRSFNYGGALVVRMLWNGAFAGIFGLMIYTPLITNSNTELLDKAAQAAGIYILPGALIIVVQAFSPSMVTNSFAAKFIREGESCYVGRNMAPPLSYQMKYITFWVILWSLKAFVSYFILVRPLVLPSLAIYEMELEYGSNVVSFHNFGVIAALWLPVIFIFNYDTQIYFTVFQASLGGIQGLIMKTGEIHGIKDITKAFRVAPQLFDQKVVTNLARSNDAAADGSAAAYQSQMMLRFVVVWNEIVNSFREGDLVDDKEAAILQYDIQSSGDVFEPVFLSAGKLVEALEYTVKLGKEGKGDSQLQMYMVQKDCLSAVRSFFTASMYVMEALLGSDDADILDALRQMEMIAANGSFMSTFDAKSLVQLRTVSMEFLEAVMDLPDPDAQSHLTTSRVHTMGIVRNFVTKMENLLNAIRIFANRPELAAKFSNSKFCSSANGYVFAARGLVNLFYNDTAMGAATRAYLLMSLEKADAMPRVPEAQRRLGFFMKSLLMDIPQLTSGMMLYEDAIKILHWLEIGSSPGKSAEQKQAQLEDMVYLALTGVQQQIVYDMNSTAVITDNIANNFDARVFRDLKSVLNTQFYIQAGFFLMLPLMCVYFGEGGFVRGLTRFFDMIITLGPAFFVFQVVFGNFYICQTDASANDNTFASDYCDTAQAYGVQTFSVWFISILWVIGPFLFNSDGLDLKKTKVDIRQWCMWMFAEEDYKDDDPANKGGWIGWWKGDLEQFHSSNMIARVTVVLRECRHFLLMFYVATLETSDVMYVAYSFGAAIATVAFLGVFHCLGMGMRSMSPVTRALLYFVTLVIVNTVYFLATWIIADWTFQYSISLWFAYVAALYGINECFRMWSFPHSSIAGIPVFQQLQFLFDFIFCTGMIIPLVVMSFIPFLNIIQTRMMYNEGFSKVMSASSQYAFSLAAFMGVLGGIGVGWLFNLLSTLEQSASFASYVVTYDDVFDGNVGDGTTTYLLYVSCVVGTIIAGFLNIFLGRRLAIVAGGLFSTLGMVAVSANDDLRATLLMPGIGLLGAACGILLPSLAIYIYEISTKEMRGKAMLLLGLGFVSGSMLSGIFATVNQLGWIWQTFAACVVIALVTPVVNVFSESPYWVLDRKGWDACEACLVILRRKPDVQEELKIMREEETPDEGGAGAFKFLIGLFLMLVSSLTTGFLNAFVSYKGASQYTDQDQLYVNATALQTAGVVIAFFFIDKLDHKSILFGTLIPVGICAGVLGFNETSNFLGDPDGSGLYISLVIMLMYFFMGLGTSSALWSACVGMFNTRGRASTTTVLFSIFYLANFGYAYMHAHDSLTTKEHLYLYAIAIFSVVSLVLLLNAGTFKNGVICTKMEAQRERDCIARMRAGRASRNTRTPGTARQRNLSRVRSKSNAGGNQRSNATSGGYQTYETPHAAPPLIHARA
ncbi:unnamed protein product [Peronospora belbahrii]|uniref:Major facilitator superfamily (MFS) profile domain-containing protein n=1 Tax=Peronospora belbahrii TaxID=622444 RepID=A0AAU9KWJ2_9STRA|nr:unnamed protein product [Peronospora belbahrii]